MTEMENLSPSDRVRELCRQLEKGNYPCSMNCYSCVKRKDKVWTCNTCFHMFHLKCVTLWASKSAAESGFYCPQCRQLQSTPSKYVCFCGKVQNPPADPGITPHSCGRTCGKKRGDCPHPCPLQCHPGPCPPCAFRKGPLKCPCGSISYTYQCGLEDPKKTCANPCGKLLNCGKHSCSETCHHGECDICMREADITCDCGRETKSFLCGTRFSCGKVCDKPLDCGNHRCTLMCHAGSCPVCPLSPALMKTCYCGASPLADGERTSCIDPIPSCGRTCRKVLSCGRHRCPQICHPGECAPCEQMFDATCACRKGGKKLVPCKEAELYRCDRICCTQLSCQRHKCMRKCCSDNGNKDAQSHVCTAPCDKKNPCGHPCPLPCHRGRCPSCLATIPTFLTCRCGQTLSAPPPLPCGTQPPECHLPCTAERSCGHPSDDHTCHFGDCPPCTFIVKRMCIGEHEEVEVACGAPTAQCNRACGKPQQCGHSCTRPCHNGDCDEGKGCKLPCGKERDTCHHYCKRPCHHSESCPECTQRVRLTCPCGKYVYQEKCCVARQKYGKTEKTSEESYNGVLECNSNCAFANRLEALSALKRPVEDDEFIFIESLYNLGLANIHYVEVVEKHFRDLLEHMTTSNVVSLPPANGEKRKLVHLLARYFRINVQSEDTGENRSCVIHATPYSALPKELLSTQLKKGTGSPSSFMMKLKKVKQNQLFTSEPHKSITNTLVTLSGYYTFHEPEEEEVELCLFFVSRTKRDEACSILRQNGIPFSRGEDNQKKNQKVKKNFVDPNS